MEVGPTMSCVHPISAWRNNYSDLKTRKRAAPVFRKPPQKSIDNGTVKFSPLPCGRCICCRIDYSRQWASRGVCELSLHDRASFITFTYNNDHLPPGGTLVKRHYQDFLRALRKRGYKFTYMVAGEYGKKLSRPHYHAIIFGEDFRRDSYRAPVAQSEDYPLYCNDELTKIWGKGHVVCGDVTFASIQYVAKYITKKISGEGAKEHYGDKLPEFMQPSLRNPIGSKWLDKYESDVYPRDEFVFQGKVMRPPKYFQRRYAKKNPEKALDLSVKREMVAEQRAELNLPERLAARKAITLARFIQHIRRLENA